MSGYGERTERGENGLTEIKDARLLARAVEKGWIKPEGSRFETHKPRNELIQRISERGDITLAERATLGTFELIDNTDPRTKGIGIRCATAMERINQIDQLAEREADPFLSPAAVDEAPATQNVQVNVIMPDNGRGPLPEIHVNGNGHTANGSH